MEIKIIQDLRGVYDFMSGAILRPDDVSKALADAVLMVSNGADGNNEVQRYFGEKVKAGETHAFLQLAETPISETGTQNEIVQVRGNVIIAAKLAETKITNEVRIQYSDEVWKKTLKLMGRLKTAGDFYEKQLGDNPDGYDCKIKTDGIISPVHRMSNAVVVGWYFEFEVEFAVNGLMYE